MNKSVLIGLIIIIGWSSSCKRDYDQLLEVGERVSGVPVEVSPIEIVNTAIPIYAVGRVGTSDEVRLSFKIGGIVESTSAQEGDYIRKGAVLATLRRDEIDAQVNKAQRAYEKAQRDLARITKMYEDGAATLENVQDLTTQVEVTKADLDIGLFNQSYATIVSPISGRVIKKSAETSELVSPGKPIYTIADNKGSSYVLKTGISDRDLSRVSIGDKASVKLDAFDKQIIAGYVSKIAETANPVTGTFDIEITMSLQGKRIRNGYIGRATITPSAKASYAKLPLSGIAEVAGDDIVLYGVTIDSLASEKRVVPSYMAQDYVYVAAALLESDSLFVSRGGAYLRDGVKVLIR